MPKIPKIPDKEELEFKEKEFMLRFREQILASSKVWFISLVVLIVLALPVKWGLEAVFVRSLISSLPVLEVNTNPYNPEALDIVRAEVISVTDNTYSAYAQVLNPNPDLSAWDLQYKFVFTDAEQRTIGTAVQQSFILSGQSRFLVLPSIRLPRSPEGVALEFERIRWTTRIPEFDIDLSLAQLSDGVSEEGNHFVQAVVRNEQGFRIKRVKVNVLVFDFAGEEILGVNSTEFSDLEPFEDRFFRVLWPAPLANTGRIEVIPVVNPLEPDIVFGQEDQIPVR